MKRMIIILFGMVSCVEPFEPDIENYDQILVIDASLTNSEPAAVVKLSRSFPYNEITENHEEGAYIVITGEDGEQYELTETASGIYKSGEDLVPETGKLYKLNIISSDGKEYESDWQEMLRAPPIDEVSYTIITREPGNYDVAEGAEIYVSSAENGDFPEYYKWEWDETWEIIAPLNIGGVKPCYESAQSSDLVIESTVNLSENSIINKKLLFISNRQSKLAERYSINIRQYSLTRDNYIYLEKLKKINQGSGGFFDPIPASLAGNFTNLSHPEIPVVGFFEASAHTQKRIFIDKEEIPFYVETGFSDCRTTEISVSDYYKGAMSDWHYVYRYWNSMANDTLVVMANMKKCFDCSYIAPRDRPDFWTDEK